MASAKPWCKKMTPGKLYLQKKKLVTGKCLSWKPLMEYYAQCSSSTNGRRRHPKPRSRVIPTSFLTTSWKLIPWSLKSPKMSRRWPCRHSRPPDNLTTGEINSVALKTANGALHMLSLRRQETEWIQTSLTSPTKPLDERGEAASHRSILLLRHRAVTQDLKLPREHARRLSSSQYPNSYRTARGREESLACTVLVHLIKAELYWNIPKRKTLISKKVSNPSRKLLIFALHTH